MQRIGDVFKRGPLEFAKSMIRKQFPKLKDKEFEIKQVFVACDSCKNGDHYERFGRRYSNLVPVYYIKIKGTEQWKLVPIPKMKCIDCQNEDMAKETKLLYEQRIIEKEVAPFWVIPEELAGANLKNYQVHDQATAEALETALQYIKDFKNGERYNILFRGSYGAGKSHLAKAIAEQIKGMRKPDGKPYKVGFIQMEHLLTMIKSTWGRREDDPEVEIIRKVTDLDFLVLDDIGSEGGEWAGKKMFEIVNGRQGKPTIYTTNFMNMDELAERYDVNGGKIVSRLHSNTKIVDIITKDHRIEKMKRGE